MLRKAAVSMLPAILNGIAQAPKDEKLKKANSFATEL